MNLPKFDYKIQNVNHLDTPTLVVYPERVQHNIDLAINMVGDASRLRPHIKTHKSPDVARLMLAAGISKFKCATIAEAEMLGIVGAPDVLLAYQPIGPKLSRFIEVIKKYPTTRYACLIDNVAAAQAQSVAFEAANLDIPVFIDLNLGQNRTGIAPDESAIALFEACSTLKGIHVVGLHGYDGHLRNLDWAVRKADCDAAFDKLKSVEAEILRGGKINQLTIVSGGSPSFSVHSKRENVECSPGTFIYWDKGYGDLCAEQPFQHAALLVTRVISLPDATKICLDLGHKSVASENSINNRVFFLNAPELVPLSQSEEHLVLEAGEGHAYKVGDVLYGLPYHICPTVALFERVFTIENGHVSGEWLTIARDRKITC
ncbi:MAG: D-TA family PLP-dependent enzyme [Saprospiraceae bacterium]|nr:D-TA family PLP-dependent enzyme [Saprospiraceae bacterium]